MIPVDSYTYIVDHLKLLLCDSLNRPISIGLIFLCGNESTFHLISAEISATPKSHFLLLLSKVPQSLMRSALPPAVNRRGEASQPLGFLLLIFGRAVKLPLYRRFLVLAVMVGNQVYSHFKLHIFPHCHQKYRQNFNCSA